MSEKSTGKDSRTASRKKNKKKKITPLKIIIILIAAAAVVVAGASIGFIAGAVKNMPEIDGKMLVTYDASSFVYDKDDNLIDTLHAVEDRVPVSYGDISENMINALVAVEDQRFYSHHGVDLYRIAGAFVANIKSGRVVQGGSTLTQQLVGYAILDSETAKTYTGKLQEAIMAVKLENEFSKEEILEMYLNHVYFGHGTYGVEAAANKYFSKKAAELTVTESAMLAGLIQGPAIHSPINHPENAVERRNTVLALMEDYGSIEKDELEAYMEEPLNLNLGGNSETEEEQSPYQYFLDYILEETIDKLELTGSDVMKVYTEGFKIYTTMDPVVQEKMEEIYSDPANFPASNVEGEIIQSAMTVIDHHTGEVKGLIGGREQTGQRLLNRAVSSFRQPGSTFKPLAVYGPSLEAGYSPASVYDDFPAAYPVPDQEEDWIPVNYNERYRGLVSMRTAIKYSINTVAVKALKEIGVPAGFRFAENLGISTLQASGTKNDMGLSLALGGLTNGVNTLEMAAAYGAFGNGGVFVEPFSIREIRDSNDNVVWEHTSRKRVAMSPETAYLMTDMLMSVVDGGTAPYAKIPGIQVAGKTGTTSNDVDAWFLGYTPNLTGAVWLGFDQPTGMESVWGGSSGGPIWQKVMAAAHENIDVRTFEVPADITTANVDYKSGLLPSSLTPAEFVTEEVFREDLVPEATSAAWQNVKVCPVTHLAANTECPPSVETRTVLVREEPWSRYIASLDMFPAPISPEDSYLELAPCSLHTGGNVTILLSLTEETASAEENTVDVNLGWQATVPAGTGEVFYKIYRSTASSFFPNDSYWIDSTTANTYLDRNIPAGAGYHYLVVPYKTDGTPAGTGSNMAGMTGTSAAVNNTTVVADGSDESLLSVRSFTFSAAGKPNVKLSWQEPEEHGEYRFFIFRGINSMPSKTAAEQIAENTIISATEYTDTEVLSGETYYYRIVAQNITTGTQYENFETAKITVP